MIGAGVRQWRTLVVGLDVAVAIGLCVGAAGTLPAGTAPIAVVLALAATSPVAWRRASPVAAFAVAVLGLGLYHLASRDPNMPFEPYATALTAYMAGCRGARRRRDFLLVLAVGGLGLLIADPGSKGAFGVTAAWVLFVPTPLAVGVLMSRRHRLSAELAEAASRREEEQRAVAAEVAAEERNRVARELHDVTAHSLSAMVVQAGAARLMAPTDPARAQAALAVVRRSGREAMDDLRRVMGVLRRGEDDLIGTVPGGAGIAALAARLEALGLPCRLNMNGDVDSLPTAVRLVVHRVVQEALTNALKHGAGPVQVSVTCRANGVHVEVVNAMRMAVPSSDRFPQSGHGLVGMRERVGLLGGDLVAGADGQLFRVRVYVPLSMSDGSSVDRRLLPKRSQPGPEAEPQGGPGRALLKRAVVADAALAALWLVVLEVDVATNAHRSGALLLNAVVVAVMALAGIWRRRVPLAFLAAVGLLSLALSHGLTSRDYGTITGGYTIIVPLYAVGAWSARSRSSLGLVTFEVAAAVAGLAVHAPASGIVGPALLAGLAWAAGRIVRSQRLLEQRLRTTLARLTEEQEDHSRLAVMTERSRLARELHGLVASHVEAMVVQTELAEHLVGRDDERLAEAVSAIEDTGRKALEQLRAALGVLRSSDGAGTRSPQPGIGMAHEMVRDSRELGHDVRLRIEGEPVLLPPGLDLMAYRILQDAVTAEPAPGPTDIVIRFGDDCLHLEVATKASRDWPSPTIRKRVAMCAGQLAISPPDHRHGVTRLLVRLPLELDGALL